MSTTDTLKITAPSEREVMVTRQFKAPRALVFDAMTKPEMIREWYGVEGWTMDVCEVDLRVGGKWRFVSTLPDGKKIGQFGVYDEVVTGERLVNTESWEDWDAGETLVTTLFHEQDGRTTISCTTLFPSQEVRDTILKAGFE